MNGLSRVRSMDEGHLEAWVWGVLGRQSWWPGLRKSVAQKKFGTS